MKRSALFLLALMAIPVAAKAAPNCTAEPKDKWMAEEAMKAKVAALGLLEAAPRGELAQLYVIIIGGQAYPLNIFPGYVASSSSSTAPSTPIRRARRNSFSDLAACRSPC